MSRTSADAPSARRALGPGTSCMPRLGDYSQRVMNSTIAVLTTSGSEALRKC
jgi:hypothetical protein